MIFLATAQEIFTNIGYVIAALMLLMVLVVIHELGHYTAGRILKFKINEFAVGFGPTILKHVSKKTGIQYSLRPIPMGGYCAFEGEDDDTDNPEAFNNQKPWKRIIVLFAGVFNNFISAIFVIIIFFTCYGQFLPQVVSTVEGSPADGLLLAGDVIYEVDNKQVNFVVQEDFHNYLKGTGDTVKFTVIRDGEFVDVLVTKGEFTETDKDGNVSTRTGFGYLSGLTQQKLSFGDAFCRAWSFIFYVVYQILVSLIGLITGAIGLEAAGGPVTVIQTISSQIQGGFGSILYILVILSANLAIMNLIPFPALDGSQILFTIIEWIRHKPLNKKVINFINTVGLITLFILMIVLDIYHFL